MYGPNLTVSAGVKDYDRAENRIARAHGLELRDPTRPEAGWRLVDRLKDAGAPRSRSDRDLRVETGVDRTACQGRVKSDHPPQPGQTEGTMSQHHSSRRHVVVVGRSPQKMRPALQVLESAGFAATGTFNRDEAMAALTAQHRLFAVVAGGSVDREAEAELRAAAEARGGQVVRREGPQPVEEPTERRALPPAPLAARRCAASGRSRRRLSGRNRLTRGRPGDPP
jgi:hypothetical protein